MDGMLTDLDSLIRVEDALDAIREGGFTRDSYVNCNKPQFRVEYGQAWDTAQTLIRKHGGNVQAALRHVEQQIKRSA